MGRAARGAGAVSARPRGVGAPRFRRWGRSSRSLVAHPPKHHTKKKERKKVTTISHREIVGGVKGAVTTSITTAKTNPPNPGTSPLSKQYQRLLHYRNSIDVAVLTQGGGVRNPDTQTPLHYRTDSRCRFSQRGGDPKSRQLRSHNPRLTPVGPETFPLSN